MKSLSHIYENLLDEGNIIRTMYKSFSGKKKLRKAVSNYGKKKSKSERMMQYV
jgi:hypothetical protein